MPSFVLTVNGAQHTVTADADSPLLWVLRDKLQMTGTKFTHKWGGAIDTCSRFSVFFGTAHEGLFVWDGAALSPYEPKTVTAAAAGAGVGAWK